MPDFGQRYCSSYAFYGIGLMTSPLTQSIGYMTEKYAMES